MTRYETIKHHTDEASSTLNHILDSIAFTSEKTIASIVLLLSMIPETIGVGSAMGYTVGTVSAAVSLVTVKLALRDRGKLLTLPVIGKRRLFFGWALYLLNLVAGFAFVYSTGQWIDMFLIVVSFCGAVSSEQIARVIKVEMAERSRLDVQAERDAIKLAEARAKSEARTAAYVAKHAPETANERQTSTDGDSAKTVISEEQLRVNQAKGRETQTGKAQARRDDLYERLVAQYPGVDLHQIKYSEIASMMNVSANTAKRDIAALRSAGRINGRVPEGSL